MNFHLWSFAALLACLKEQVSSQQPNPPTWPSGVYVFDPSDPTTSQNVIDQAFASNGGTSPECNGQWSSDRYAFLFLPGTHEVSVTLGYYTSVHGLGMLPTDVILNDISVADCSDDYTIGALQNFWRSAENFEMTPTTTYNNLDEPTMLWAVSQAAPLRRAVINGGISLYEYTGGCCAGYASGGFMADVKVSTNIYSGSQQQFISRNVDISTSWQNGVWNIVFVGTSGSLPNNTNGDCHPFTSVTETPVIAEKPFLYYNSNNGTYAIIVPRIETNKVGSGTNWGSGYDSIDFSNVYVASPDNNDTAKTINSMLDAGYSILFGPGLYNFTSSVVINNDNTVIFGIGFPTIECGLTSGDPCIVVADGVTGVRISGLLLQASDRIYNTSSLLSMGTTTQPRHAEHSKHSSKHSIKRANYANRVKFGQKSEKSHKTRYDIEDTEYNLVVDVFARVGGTNNPSEYEVSSVYMFDINMNNVIIDNTWLWRADHDTTGEVYNGSNPVQTGIKIDGDSVVAYGLAVEHTLGNLVEWNGNGGQCYFFQSEFPYDVTQENYGDMGYAAYKVDDSVTNHTAYGVGAYSYFRDYVVTVNSGFVTPTGPDITFIDALTVFLTGNGGINHVVNDEGDPVDSSNGQSYLCSL